jgi:Flp pilus assembly protein TadG
MMINPRHFDSASRHGQRGIAAVEFAIVALATLTILFASMEMARMMFTFNTLAEVTRRGARIASICQVDDPEINRLAIFNTSGGSVSPILKKLSTANVKVEYLNENGAVLASTAGNAYYQIRYVRVRIANYQHNLIIPGMSVSVMAPGYPTTVPRESLGVPREGQLSNCV